MDNYKSSEFNADYKLFVNFIFWFLYVINTPLSRAPENNNKKKNCAMNNTIITEELSKNSYYFCRGT